MKKLIIMRGLPGSGKSTLAKKLAGENGKIFSTDEFFIKDGVYKFNSKTLPQAHQWNFNRALDAMRQNIDIIVIDNTNTQAWECKRYVSAGIEFNYEVEIKEPDTSWKFDLDELSKRNTHGVGRESIEKMFSRYEKNITINDILYSKSPFDDKK